MSYVFIYLPITKKRNAQTHFEKEDFPIGNEKVLFVDEAFISKMWSKVLELLGDSLIFRTDRAEAPE